MSRKIRIGSRKSRLAVIQTELVMDTIRETHPEIELELITMETTGDRRLDVTLIRSAVRGCLSRTGPRSSRGQDRPGGPQLKGYADGRVFPDPHPGIYQKRDVGMCWCCRKEESPGRAGA